MVVEVEDEDDEDNDEDEGDNDKEDEEDEGVFARFIVLVKSLRRQEDSSKGWAWKVHPIYWKLLW